MALKTLSFGAHRLPRSNLHCVRFTSDELPKYQSSPDSPPSSLMSFSAVQSSYENDSGAPSPESSAYQPAALRYSINEHRIKLLTAINQIVQQRAELESSRSTLGGVLDELRRKLKRRVEECHAEKKDKLRALKQANTRLEKEKSSIVSEIEHLQRHLVKEESHHVQHARAVVAQAIQGVAKGGPDQLFNPCSINNLPNLVSRSVARHAPSRTSDSKLAAARLMRDIAELRQRVAQVEARLANELRRKRQAEVDIVRLRKDLSASKSNVACLRLPPPPLRAQCNKFA